MRIEWLVAALLPPVVAPHPNFSQEEISPYGLLALASSGRLSEYDRYAEALDQSKAPSTEGDLPRAVRDSLMAESQADGVARLEAIRTRPGADTAAQVVAGLFEVVGLCELGRHESVDPLLVSLLETALATQSRTPSADLLAGVVAQQRSMRLAEAGEFAGSVRMARAAIAYLPGSSARFETFHVSKGSRITARAAQASLVRAIRSNANALLAMAEGSFGKRWVRVVRTPQSVLQAQANIQLAEVGEGIVDELFEERIAWSAGRRRILFRDSVDSSVSAAHLSAELSGAYGSARALRVQLGKTRAVRGQDLSEWSATEALRLLSHGNGREPLEDVIRLVRASGPLVPLRDAGRRVIDRHMAGGLSSRCDVAMLVGAAELLDGDELARALDVVAKFRREPLLSLGERAHQSSIDEISWRASARILPGSGRDALVADSLRGAVTEGAPYLESLEGAVVAVLTSLTWKDVPPETTAWWRSWAVAQVEGPHARVAWTLLDQVDGVRRHRSAPPRQTGLALGVRLLREAHAGEEPADDELAAAVDACVSQMERVRESAASGSYGFGGYSAVDVACALAGQFGVDRLWVHIADFLTDERVGRHDKDAALDRLASGLAVPEEVRAILVSTPERALAGRPAEMFGPEPALSSDAVVWRLKARLGHIDRSARISNVSELAASPAPQARIEAARSIEALLLPDSVDVAATVLLQLSQDQDSVVRSEGGRELARLSSRLGQLSDSATLRIAELLHADGILVPLLVVRGIGQAGRCPERLRPAIDELSKSHPARSVRLAARSAMELPGWVVTA